LTNFKAAGGAAVAAKAQLKITQFIKMINDKESRKQNAALWCRVLAIGSLQQML
jgi:hypothetical protein